MGFPGFRGREARAIPKPVDIGNITTDDPQQRYETADQLPARTSLELNTAATVASVEFHKRGGPPLELRVLVVGTGSPHLWVVERVPGSSEYNGVVIHYDDRIIADALAVVEAVRRERQAQGFTERGASLTLKYHDLFLREVSDALEVRNRLVKSGIFLE
jgi:hypothetical protein